MKNTIFTGCGTAIITPFHAHDFSVNYEEFDLLQSIFAQLYYIT